MTPALRRRVDVLLVERGHFASRAKAQEAIEAGLVEVDGTPVRRPSDMVDAESALTATRPYPWVSRGGVKLAAALDAFGLDPRGLNCLDIGASTGGFTDVLLARGAQRVAAVDVGHGQLHPRLEADPRVLALEGLDARDLDAVRLGFRPSLIVCDASFIPLDRILPPVLSLAAPEAALVALVKPQFEAGRAAVRKGIVRDAEVHRAVTARAVALLEGLGWSVAGVIASPITGREGNQEFLVAARHRDA